MKLRIYNNSIRIRLSKPEVEQFCRDKNLRDHISFPGNNFSYALQVLPGMTEFAADFAQGTMTITVPEAVIQNWDTSEETGFQATVDSGKGELLRLIIEKDFKCKENNLEDQSQNYDNPGKTC